MNANCLGYHRLSDPIRLTQDSFSVSHESQYVLSWVAHASNVVHIGNDYVQVWCKVSQQCRHCWIWMLIVWTARRGHPWLQRERGRRNGCAGLIPAMGPFTEGWEERCLFLGGNPFPLLSSSKCPGHWDISLGDRNSWSGFLENWRSQICATLVCLFHWPWQSVATDNCLHCLCTEAALVILWGPGVFLLLASCVILNNILQLKGT